MSTVDLPKINQPFIDPVSGQISRPWWIWLQQLMTRIGGSNGTDLSALQAAVTALIVLTREQGNEISGFVPLPPDTDEGADEGMVFMPPQDLSTTSPVLSVFGRTGVVTAQAGDYTVGQVTNAASVLLTLAQFAATTSAQLAGVISDETGSGALVFGTNPTIAGATTTGGSINNTPIGATTPNTGAFTTLSATGAITPSQTAGIVGTTTNNNANAGSFGEYTSNPATGVALTTATSASVTSVSLTAGDWDVSGVVTFVPAGTTTVAQIIAGISTVNNTLPANNSGGYNLLAATLPTGAAQAYGSPVSRISLAATTTVYLIAQATFGVSTMTANGFIRARRVR